MTTSRERVLQALNHERPDRVPRDFWAETPALRRLLDHTGLPDEEALLQRLQVDMRHLNAIQPADREIAPGVWQNYWGERFIQKPTPWGPMREDLPGALADVKGDADVPEAFEQFPWPTPDLFDYSGLAAQAAQHADYALIYGFADVWQRPALVRGWENMFLDMAARPDWVHYLCRKFTDFYKEDYTRAAEVTGGRIDLFLLLSDLGSQHGPLVSLPMFRALIAPYLKEMVDRIHALGARVMFHSCGDVSRFIPDLIEMGVDLLDPIQPVNERMAPEALQAQFGGQIAFHGGIDMQGVLPFGTPEQVRAEVTRYSDLLGQHGGYILAPTHLFQPDVRPENVLAMYPPAQVGSSRTDTTGTITG
ncbi:MAG: uroporphyrinogen decarboxylase family protein [Armatimonadia bacterium]